MLPNDPFLLFSVINTKLRDYYKNLDELCYDLQIDKTDIINKISSIGYEYDEKLVALIGRISKKVYKLPRQR